MKHRLIILATFMVLSCVNTLAGAPIGFKTAAKILGQDSSVAAFVRDTLDVRADGLAVRVGPQFEHLSGSRIGPYSFEAKTKGSEAFTLEITVCTTVTWLSNDGTEARDMFSAWSFAETFESLVIRKAGARGYAACGGGS